MFQFSFYLSIFCFLSSVNHLHSCLRFTSCRNACISLCQISKALDSKGHNHLSCSLSPPGAKFKTLWSFISACVGNRCLGFFWGFFFRSSLSASAIFCFQSLFCHLLGMFCFLLSKSLIFHFRC